MSKTNLPLAVAAVPETVTTADGLEVTVDHRGSLSTSRVGSTGLAYRTLPSLRGAHDTATRELEQGRRLRERMKRDAAADEVRLPAIRQIGHTLERVTVLGWKTTGRTLRVIRADGTEGAAYTGTLLADLPDDDERMLRLRQLLAATAAASEAENAAGGVRAGAVLPAAHVPVRLDPATGRFATEYDGHAFTGDSLREVEHLVLVHALSAYPWTVGGDEEKYPVPLADAEDRITVDTPLWSSAEAVDAYLAASAAYDAAALARIDHAATFLFDTRALSVE